MRYFAPILASPPNSPANNGYRPNCCTQRHHPQLTFTRQGQGESIVGPLSGTVMLSWQKSVEEAAGNTRSSACYCYYDSLVYNVNLLRALAPPAPLQLQLQTSPCSPKDAAKAAPAAVPLSAPKTPTALLSKLVRPAQTGLERPGPVCFGSGLSLKLETAFRVRVVTGIVVS